MKEQLLPHFNERKAEVDMLVLHSTASSSDEAVKGLDEMQISAHYIIALNGDIIKVVEEKNRAWHTGEAFWQGSDKDFNSRSIGIEICNMSLGQEPYNEMQITKLIAFCQKLMRKYKIEPRNVLGHSDIAPTRKPDPGLAFPWKRLAREGLGLWYEPKNAAKMNEEDVATLLAIIGYDTRDEAAIKASAYAFCRHFLPPYVEKDENVGHLVNNILPSNFDFMKEAKFINTLKAVAYSYK